MSSLIIQDSTLTDIADAIRLKTGSNSTMTPGQMATAISNLSLSDKYIPNQQDLAVVPYYWNYKGRNDWLLKYYLNDISFTDEDFSCCFRESQEKLDLSNKTITIPSSIEGLNLHMLFYQSNIIKPFKIIGDDIKIKKIDYLFTGCPYLKEVPNDFLTYNSIGIKNYGEFGGDRLFYGCNSLEKIPSGFLNDLYMSQNFYIGTGGNQNPYALTFTNCYILDSINNLFVIGTNSDFYNQSLLFSQTFNNCYRLKRLTFVKNNNSPYISYWRDAYINLTTCGYVPGTLLSNYNAFSVNTPINWPIEDWPFKQGLLQTPASNIIYNDITYNSNKNNDKAVAISEGWSRYNHASMVETINSLPDTSVVSNPNNQIVFKSGQGSLTDEGGPEALTAAEIAVATAKGWTVVIQ